MKEQKQEYWRGDVYYASFAHSTGSEIFGIHPVVIVQNNIGNYHSGTVIGVVLTSQNKKQTQPTHVILEEPKHPCDGAMAMAEQLYTIDKGRLLKHIGHLSAASMDRIDEALQTSLALNSDRTELMCLCPRCMQRFRDLPNHFVRRVDRYQQIKDVCTFCGHGMGYDYWVSDRTRLTFAAGRDSAWDSRKSTLPC